MEAVFITKSRSHTAVILTGLVIFLILLFLISLSIGAVSVSVREIIQILVAKVGIGTHAQDVQSMVLLNIRLPRLVFTVLIGAALGISGGALQGLFRNPLVEPGTIGVSSGAALGAILVILGGKLISPVLAEALGNWLSPLFAFLGGIAATLVTLRLGSYEGRTQITILILAGVAISAIASAAIGLSIFYADEQQLRTFSFWTLGDLSVATWQKIAMLTPIISISVVGLVAMAKPLNALALGEAEAFHSGVHVERLKISIILLCAMAIGTSVAFAGIISFVGLVVPHVIRMLFSPDHELVLPASAITGACLLILADIFARTIVAPAELPIGIVTAIVGTPFFLYLLISTKRKKML
ncbi:MAG TPA: iron ABC transporter permease [Cyclobacteriaceae bacterium]|jgi:iron complex transport system permease protein|nr:iron ABC transporter permease [Cyclobacteriaceae bacterium]